VATRKATLEITGDCGTATITTTATATAAAAAAVKLANGQNPLLHRAFILYASCNERVQIKTGHRRRLTQTLEISAHFQLFMSNATRSESEREYYI
jgi:hypothetical protein